MTTDAAEAGPKLAEGWRSYSSRRGLINHYFREGRSACGHVHVAHMDSTGERNPTTFQCKPCTRVCEKQFDDPNY